MSRSACCCVAEATGLPTSRLVIVNNRYIFATHAWLGRLLDTSVLTSQLNIGLLQAAVGWNGSSVRRA